MSEPDVNTTVQPFYALLQCAQCPYGSTDLYTLCGPWMRLLTIMTKMYKIISHEIKNLFMPSYNMCTVPMNHHISPHTILVVDMIVLNL